MGTHSQMVREFGPTGSNMTTAHEIIEQGLRDLIAVASERIGAELGPACPTEGFLVALAEEISTAVADPTTVPYPDLVDPNAYWEASVRPQGEALQRAVDEILSWLESGVISIMEVAEADMKATVDAAAAEGGADPVALRRRLAAGMDQRCMELHHLMAEILNVVPDDDQLAAAKQGFERRLEAQSVADVDALKTAYMAEAGGDDAHQRFAEQQWSETHGERVIYRQALLRAEPPWRHQEIALVGYERSLEMVREATEAVVERLQAPLADMSSLILQRYDSIGSA